MTSNFYNSIFFVKSTFNWGYFTMGFFQLLEQNVQDGTQFSNHPNHSVVTKYDYICVLTAPPHPQLQQSSCKVLMVPLLYDNNTRSKSDWPSILHRFFGCSRIHRCVILLTVEIYSGFQMVSNLIFLERVETCYTSVSITNILADVLTFFWSELYWDVERRK